MLDLLVYATEENGDYFEGLGEIIDIGEIVEMVTSLFGELWPLIALAIGVPFGFYIFRRIKGLVNGS